MTRNRRAIKKKQWENKSVKSAEETPSPAVSPRAPAKIAPAAVPVENVHPLMAEVQSFLSRRDELARKLKEEIEATEKKLGELRITLASLYPENNGNPQSDRKSKKQKSKSSHRDSKTEPSQSVEQVQPEAPTT